jgi:hypothetical protein
MNIARETVSPRKAMLWLKNNVRNRPLSQLLVKNYAAAMKDGAWMLNGDAIRFNCNGDLIDGQHRLAACIKSDTPFECYVIRGLQHEAFDTIDQGRRRSLSDVFARDGYKNYKTLAAATRWFWLYGRGFKCFGETLRPDKAHELIEANPSLHHAADAALRLYREQRLVNPGLLAFLIFVTGQSDQDKADTFWASAITGQDLTKGSAAHLLHKRLVANATAVARLHVNTIAAIGIKAWNAYITKTPIATLRWSENEEFPTVKN